MSKQTLSKLIIQRNAHRNTTKRLLEKIEAARDDEKIREFNKIFETLESKCTILETLNEKILSLMDEDGIEEEIVNTDEYSLDLSIRLDELRDLRPIATESQSYEREQQWTHSNDRGVISQPTNQTEHLTSQLSINHAHGVIQGNQAVSNESFISTSAQSHKLPKLILPTFDGNVLHWQTFWDCFETSVHNNPCLSSIQKFSYLKSQLEGIAAMTIEGFSLTNANYSKALELLRERYGQQHKIIQATMQALLQLPSPTFAVRDLSLFHDKMESYIRGLESLNQSQDTYGSLLVPILLDKLPSEMRKNIARENEHNNWTLENLRKAINREINILEAGDSKTLEIRTQNPTAMFYTASQSITDVDTNTSVVEKPVKCAYCRQEHYSNECREFASQASRVGEVKWRRMCFNCLGNHYVVNCQSKRTCRYCDKKHHTSICFKNPRFKSDIEGAPKTTIMNVNHDKPDILLKTAVAEVENEGHYAYSNILFDEGAQRSFITEELANELGVIRKGTEQIRLASFGSQQQDLSYQDIGKAEIFLITDNSEKVKLDVLIIPSIAVPLQITAHNRVSNLPYLSGLKLAHPFSSEDKFEISLLIGADQYWKVVEDKVIRGNGPTAVQSKVGYLLSGPLPTDPDETNTHMMLNITQSYQSENQYDISIDLFPGKHLCGRRIPASPFCERFVNRTSQNYDFVDVNQRSSPVTNNLQYPRRKRSFIYDRPPRRRSYLRDEKP